ncbi:hypothetical protein [Lewinella sp. IMCC34183]|uniref:hypothetical protein n=1 Tax=Lewinella sp. IMCC34183 TaxID=2248762 RepID=UPI000E2859BB|nr:hypothetical protein [Lewinella sp. IMCC34183]
MPNRFRSSRHLIVLVACLALLALGVYQAYSFQQTAGDGFGIRHTSITVTPWILLLWIVGAVGLIVVFRRRA